MSFPGLGIVVLTYGDSGVHEPLFGSLQAEGVTPAQIVVVHNPAVPGEPSPRLPEGCQLVRSDHNRGYAGGMNMGIEAWRERPDEAELLLLLTHDARLRPGSLAELLAAIRGSPAVGVLGPALFETGTEIPFSFGGRTDRGGATSHIKAQPDTDSGIAPCDWVDGGTLLLRLELIERVGAFDERFFAYCEESDLCLRARRAGFGVGVVVSARADQDSGANRRLGAWAYLNTRNGAEYARRAVGPRGAVSALLRASGQVALSLARVALRTVRKRPGGPREPWLLAVGTARGAADFLLRRWGPPPRGLPGMGDVENV